MDSSSISISKAIVFPSPNQLFSFTLKINVPPEVPIPAPALISPVAPSSTSILIILRLSLVPLSTLYVTFLKIPLALILAIDFSILFGWIEIQ